MTTGPAPLTASVRPTPARGVAVRMSGLAWYRLAGVLIIGLSVALGGSWVVIDRTPPSFDQAGYLWDSLGYVNAFHSDGATGIVNAFLVDRFRNPGYPAIVFPFMLALGPSVQSALVANLLLWTVLLLTVAAIARQLFGPTAGLIAMAVTTTIPILLVLLHEALVDLAALTFTCLALLAMLRTNRFTQWLPAVMAGLFAGIGLLTKATVLVFLAGPILLMGTRAAVGLRHASSRQRFRVGANLLLMVLVAAAVAAPWYAINWNRTLTYFLSATSGPLSVGVAPDNPLDPVATGYLGMWLLNDLSLGLAIGVALVAVMIVAERWKHGAGGLQGPTKTLKRRWTWAVLISLVVVPMVVLVSSHNWDPRQAVVAFPAVAIIFAGLSSMVRSRLLRVGTVAAVLIVGAGQVALAELPPGSALRDGVTVGGLALFAPAYSAADPAADDATPVMRELEAVGGGRPARVLVAEQDHVFNANTLRWLAGVRGEQLTFGGPLALTGDPAALDSYDLAIYVPAFLVAQRNPDNRLDLLNKTSATTVFGDQLFSIFGKSRHGVAIAGGTAWVLER